MYDKRVKIFVAVSAMFLLVCVLRLIQMQLLPDSSLQSEIEELKHQRGLSRQLKTIRGRILDRKGRILAFDEPRFHLCIEYSLSCFLDPRVRKAKLLHSAKHNNDETALSKLQEELQNSLEDLQQVIAKCTQFGFSQEDIEEKIGQINDKLWNLCSYLAWKRNNPDIDFSQSAAEPNEHLLKVAEIDIAEMHWSWPLFELKTDDDVLIAQLEFIDTDKVTIRPEGHRYYPYKSAAAQTIGWVGPATGDYKNLFENDRLASYLHGEVCGKRPGVEYVCESALRGRRGELVYDIDRQLVSRTETQFGKDVQLTLDIELQQRIENYLANYPHDPNCGPGMAAVVIDVATGDILALVSMPVFDLNRARYDYGTLVVDGNVPMINRAINKQYPPGSVVKPLILIAGLEAGKITADEIINCTSQEAPFGWPNCLIYNRYKRGHDGNWSNYARNAIKGSCNIYFSRLADRIEPLVLQQWLFKFGYGQTSSLLNRDSWLVTRDPYGEQRATSDEPRALRQAPGQISTIPPENPISSFEQIPVLKENERRLFGIGQGNLRATPLQVASAMAAIARGGIFKQPRLFFDSSLVARDSSLGSRVTSHESRNLNITQKTLEIIYDGMSAVVNEPRGTAHKEFAPVLGSFTEQYVKVFGKTGSTEEPDVAWFAGFAEDSAGAKLAIAVVVEGGQHGSSDAAPLARDIIQFCIESGYIGRTLSTTSTR